jgi:hypothetical protein
MDKYYKKYRQQYLKLKHNNAMQTGGKLCLPLNDKWMRAGLETNYPSIGVGWGQDYHANGNDADNDYLYNIFRKGMGDWYIKNIPDNEHYIDSKLVNAIKFSFISPTYQKNIKLLLIKIKIVIPDIVDDLDYKQLNVMDDKILTSDDSFYDFFTKPNKQNVILKDNLNKLLEKINPFIIPNIDYAPIIDNNDTIQKAGIIFQQLKVIIEKKQKQFDSTKEENVRQEYNARTTNVNSFVNIIQSMIYHHIKEKKDNIHTICYDKNQNPNPKFYNHQEYKFIIGYSNHNIEQYLTQDPKFYEEPEYKFIIKHLDELIKQVPNDKIESYDLPFLVKDIYKLSQPLPQELPITGYDVRFTNIKDPKLPIYTFNKIGDINPCLKGITEDDFNYLNIMTIDNIEYMYFISDKQLTKRNCNYDNYLTLDTNNVYVSSDMHVKN